MTRELCIMACVFCKDGQFKNWATKRCADLKLEVPGNLDTSVRERIAKHVILHLAQINSRNELDTDPEAAKRFHDLVRKPFIEWRDSQ